MDDKLVEKLTQLYEAESEDFLVLLELVGMDRRSDLAGADLSGAELTSLDFSGCDLRQTDLSGANLAGANLSNADLREAVLRGANLAGCNFMGARLEDAMLKGARLEGAIISGTVLEAIKDLESYIKGFEGYIIDQGSTQKNPAAAVSENFDEPHTYVHDYSAKED